jgi:lipopolysaccharide export LptBFGC system permease protein LptF
MAKLEALKKINDGNAYEIKNNIYLCMGDAERLPYIFEVKENGKSFVDIFVERVNNYYNNTKSEKVENDDNDTLKSDGDYIVYISPKNSVYSQVCLGRKYDTYDSSQKPYYNFDGKEWQHTARDCWISLEEMKENLEKYNIKEYKSKII